MTALSSGLGRSAAFALSVMASAAGADAATVPTIDTEDASLGSQDVGDGRFHPIFGVDVRNGDFARGGYDDDAANLDRLPVHAQLGFAWDLHGATSGKADAWLVGSSSNGFHSPASYERTSPRAWYESNNLRGLVAEPAKGLRAGVAYTVKTSPNDVSGTSHEASVTASYEAKHGIGWLHPAFAATIRPKGGHGLYTQVAVEPGADLSSSDHAIRIAVPLLLGVGWRGFYEAGSGTVVYGSAGLGLSKPVEIGGTHVLLRAQGLALVRDDTLRRIGDADAETSHVVPLVTIGVTVGI